jgi:hypothetical protein
VRVSLISRALRVGRSQFGYFQSSEELQHTTANATSINAIHPSIHPSINQSINTQKGKADSVGSYHKRDRTESLINAHNKDRRSILEVEMLQAHALQQLKPYIALLRWDISAQILFWVCAHHFCCV